MKGESNHSWREAILRHVRAAPATVALVGTILSLIVLSQSEEWRAQYISLVLINGVYWILILHLSWHIIGHRCPEFFGIPQVKKILRNHELIVVEKSSWLGIGVATTIYVVEDDFERFVCIGEVVNIQHNNLVQIAIRNSETCYNSDDEIWNIFERTNKKFLLVKPGPYRGDT